MPYSDPIKQKEAQARAYQAKKDAYNKRAREQKRQVHEWFMELKKQFSCVNCPENHPDCIDFHHKDPKTKKALVSVMAWSGFSKEKILEEMEKCEAMCANCHRKLHGQERRLRRGKQIGDCTPLEAG